MGKASKLKQARKTVFITADPSHFKGQNAVLDTSDYYTNFLHHMWKSGQLGPDSGSILMTVSQDLGRVQIPAHKKGDRTQFNFLSSVHVGVVSIAPTDLQAVFSQLGYSQETFAQVLSTIRTGVNNGMDFILIEGTEGVIHCCPAPWDIQDLWDKHR